MFDYKDRTAERLEAAVRRSLEGGQLGADAAPRVHGVDFQHLRVPQPVATHAGVAVNGNGNVIHIGVAPRGRPDTPGYVRGRILAACAGLIVILGVVLVAFH